MLCFLPLNARKKHVPTSKENHYQPEYFVKLYSDNKTLFKKKKPKKYTKCMFDVTKVNYIEFNISTAFYLVSNDARVKMLRVAIYDLSE